MDLDDAKRLEEKMRKGQFTLEDFLDQLRQMKKLGPLESIVGLLPGGAEALKGQDLSKQEKEIRHMEAMVCGMTPQERRNPHILNARRRQRIAKSSGVTVTQPALKVNVPSAPNMLEMTKNQLVKGRARFVELSA